MAQYMLFLYGGDFDQYTPEQMREISGRYLAWLKKTTETVRVVGGAPLQDAGKVLRGSGAATKVTDGPFAETKEVLGGYYLLEAQSEADAVEFSRDCPHLDFGAVEIREVIPVSNPG